MFVRVQADDGTVGWGEAITQFPQSTEATIRLIDGIAEQVVGTDPMANVATWRAIKRATWWYAYRGGPVAFALSAIDIALWDLKGKLLGQPLIDLIGGAHRERVPALASTHAFNPSIEYEAERHGRYVREQGYIGVKIGMGKRGQARLGYEIARDAEFVRLLREAVGPEAWIMMDRGQSLVWDVGDAIRRTRLFEEHDLKWIEEPLEPEDVNGLRTLRGQVTTMIAAGEREWDARGFGEVIDSGLVDVIGCDIGRAEGITGALRVIALVEQANVWFNSHAWSSAVNTAASIALSASTPRCMLQELKPDESPMQHELVDVPFVPARRLDRRAPCPGDRGRAARGRAAAIPLAGMTALSDLIELARSSYDPGTARRSGGRALFDYLACRADGRRRVPAGIGDAGAAVAGDRDDLHWPSLTHPGAIVWSAVRAGGVPEGELWQAAHVGYEVTARLGIALGPEHRRYWHATTTAGTVGAAAAVAVATGRDAVRAAAHAVSVTGGSILCILERTATRMVHRDHAVATALRCAEAADLSAALDCLEHSQGLFAAMGGSADQLLAAGPARAGRGELPRLRDLGLQPGRGRGRAGTGRPGRLRRRARRAAGARGDRRPGRHHRPPGLRTGMVELPARRRRDAARARSRHLRGRRPRGQRAAPPRGAHRRRELTGERRRPQRRADPGGRPHRRRPDRQVAPAQPRARSPRPPPGGRVTLKVAALPGDGVGPEVIREARRALDAVGVPIEWTELEWGSAYRHRHGTMMAPDAIDVLREHDAILMGAVGDPSVPDSEALWGLILKIRQELDLGLNVRPARLLDGVACPLAGRTAADIDMVFVRENTEGEYSGVGGRVHRGRSAEVAIESTVFTRDGCSRVIRYAFRLAQSRNRVLTSATKSNASRYAFTFWDDVVEEIAAEFPDVAVDRILVDALCARLITDPGSVDVVVASNLFGDILTDLAAALQGGMGMAASANLGLDGGPGLFEPVHGSAPDIAGRGVANPSGAIWSAALMLEYLGQSEAAARLMGALEAVARSGPRTRDLGGDAMTTEVGDAVVGWLEDGAEQPRVARGAVLI